MKLITWIEIYNLKLNDAAKLLGVKHSHIYKYLHEKSVPKRKIMERIILVTKGAVMPNDFYEINDEMFREKLVKNN